MKTIQEIQKFPIVIGNSHESLLRSYQTLQLVKDMLKRNDSHETIIMVIRAIEED